MAFRNARLILKTISGASVIKLLLITARYSRPTFGPIWTALLRPFARNGEIPIQYTQGKRTLHISLRNADQSSDLHSVIEVVVRQAYKLDPTFAADLVIDGGANIGLFVLQAAAVYPSASLVVCEPLPRNIEQLEKNLSRNNVHAKLMPVCLGGARGNIPFYCRHANASSFDPSKPYDHVLAIDVLPLADLVNTSPAKKILIKLDIEGMEIETLRSFVPHEDRAVVVFGELHGHKENASTLRSIFADRGWSFELGDLSGEDTIFEAHSPAALQSRST